MRGVSGVIVAILTLMIGIALVSLAFIFFLGTMEETTEVGEAVVERTTQLLTTKYKIESLEQGTPGHIYIRNMGSNDVTGISIYINGVLDTTAVIPPSIAPNQVGTIDVIAGLNPGDEVKVTGAQGSLVIATVPGGAPPPPPCTPDGCNANCPAGCSVLEDPDCGCQDGNGCCGIGCNPANDNDCGAVCVPDGCNANCPAGCTVAQDPDCLPCQDGNGCCGIGCDFSNDNDCPPPSGLVAFWAFDGDATDSSGSGNDGTIFGPTFVSGVSASALDFDGINDYVRVEDDPTLDLTDEFTLAAWIYPRTFGEGGYGRVIEKAATGGYTLYVRNNSAQDQLATLINGSVYASSFNAIQTGVWQHVVVTFDSNLGSNQIEFFVDGAPAGTANRNQPTQTNGNRLFIGNRAATDRSFDGIIDEVKIWNYALTPAEILAEYSSYSPPGPDTEWGQSTSFSSSGRTSHATVRCMGGRAPNLPNMKIKSLLLRFNNTATGAMAIYFGGVENNPNGASRQVQILNQPITAGWNTFTLSPELNWPANQITWICWKRSGAGYLYYNTTSSFTTDFFTSHGRHDDGSSSGGPANPFNISLSAASFSSYWYEVYLTYYQT